MDPDYTDTRSNLYGVGKGRTYERPDARQHVQYRHSMSRLVQPHPRVIAFP